MKKFIQGTFELDQDVIILKEYEEKSELHIVEV